MARTLDLSDLELLSLSEALEGGREMARARLWKGGQITPPRPMLWPCPVDALTEAHSRPSEAPHADVQVIREAVVGGGGSQPTKDGAYVYAATAYPGYIKAYLDQDITPEVWAFEPGRLRTIRVPRAFAVLHFNLMWGHWLTEVFPKLFAIRALAAMGVRAPILVPSNAPVYAARIIRDVLPGQELVTYDPATHKVLVKQLIMPPMLQHFYVFHPRFGEALDLYARPAGRPSSRLFVSRGGMRTAYAYRELVNEPELEAAAAETGFRIVRPEALPWREQLALFAGARVIAGEFGSGLHNTLFSPHAAKVVALNCIGDTQSRIANFRGQDIGYVLPDDGLPRVFHQERSLQRYRVDPSEFREKLAIAVEAAEAPA